MRKILFLLFLFFILIFQVFSQTENLNYNREITVVKRGNTTQTQVDQLVTGDKFQTTTYLDGLGRPIQNVSKEMSMVGSLKNDIVTLIDYDELGRQPKTYLTYPTSTTIGLFKNDVTTAQPQYFSNTFGESPSYSTTSYNNSPLNLVTKTMLPGNNWGGSNVGISSDYDLNASNENVHIWTIGYTSGSIPTTDNTTTGLYAAEQLFKNTTTDELGNLSITYTDKSGHVILTKVQDKSGTGLTTAHAGWLCTYNVYDDFGHLRYVIPPKAVVYLDNNNWAITTDIANELCTSYEYDARGRVIVKKSPGADAVYYVYDYRDRLIFSQDGNQRNQSPVKWSVILYDNQDRITATGLMDYSSSRATLQSWVDNNTTNNGTNGSLSAGTATISQTNLVINSRSSNTPSAYTATNSITFTSGFISGTNDYFVAQIGSTSQSLSDNINVNANPLPAGNNFYPLTLNFYDDYSYTGAKSFTNNFTIDNTVASNESETVQSSAQTLGFITGTRVRLLDGGNTFLTTTSYYDYEGRAIQILGDNHKGLTNEITTQYDFSGKVRSTYEYHRFDGNNDITVYTHNSYDLLGRLISVGKSINGSAEKTIASYTYNELGQLATKKLAPGFSGEDGPQVETLNYTYNIQGWLIGINQPYAASSARTGNYFGMELGYDKAGSSNFTNLILNGNVAGNAWKTRGDNVNRKYDYSYDKENRVTNAAFTQKNISGAGWTNDKVDFTSNYSYDENGNITSQNQWGIAPGLTPTQVDKLVYHYDIVSGGLTNRLSRIEEQITALPNGALGDFKNGSAGSATQQYWYDHNANTNTDLNKEIGTSTTSGIQYNVLNLPASISFHNTNETVSYVYDAAGNKLRMIVDQPANGSNPARHIETDYDNEFVYKTIPASLGGTGLPVLQFFSTEEGRVRDIKPIGTSGDPNYDGGGIALQDGTQGIFDYFIKDNLSNVRMILTEEGKQESDACTMEDANIPQKQHEESVFGQTGSNNEVAVTRTDKPTSPCGTYSQGWMSNSSLKVSMLSGLTHKIGPNVILRVMSGDKISAMCNYYYKNNNNTTTNNNLLNDIVTTLVGNITSGKTDNNVKASATTIQSTLSNVSTSPLNTFLQQERPTEPQTSAPRGYLNIIFFDEQFNYVNSYFMRVSTACDASRPPLTLINEEALKNGWCYIYLSDESDEPVYFDNFQVAQTHGRIIEENHYYSYGLKINGINSQAVQPILNNYGYQGDYSENNAETSLDEFELRHYDPQTGRWTTADPYEQYPSPYTGLANNPVSYIDPDGGSIFNFWDNDLLNHFADAAMGSLIGGVAGYIADGSQGVGRGMTIGGGLGLGAGFVNWSNVGSALGDAGNWFGGLFQGNEWQNVSILLAQSAFNGAGSGDDWVRNSNPQGIPISDLATETNNSLINDLRSTIHTYTSGVFEDIGDKMVDHFAANSGTDFSDPVLDNQITASSQFQNSFNNALQLIKTRILEINSDFSLYGKPQNFINPSFPKWDAGNPFSPNSLYTLIGGTQYSDITLNSYKYNQRTKSFSGRITTTVMDDFGVSASDVKKASKIPFSKGIRAMWYLQHIRGYKPYRTVYKRQFIIKF